MKDIRLCIVGAGSSYTPELIEGILNHAHDELPISAIHLHDVNRERLEIMAGLTSRTFLRAGRPAVIRHDTRLQPMLEGVGFVITQVRVGGMSARHLDESIPLKYGIVGQETTGPGGMFKALRTIPAILEIVTAVERAAPEAFILNFTNPSGIVTEAALKNTRTRFIGLCSGIPSMQKHLAAMLHEIYADLTVRVAGLNHLGFVYRFLSEGKDVTTDALQRLCADGRDVLGISPDLVRTLGAVPISYVNYYYHRRRIVRERQTRNETRAQEIMRLEADVFREAADPTFAGKPAALARRGGGGYSSITFDVLKAILNDTGAELVVSVANRGAVEGIADDAAVEVTCRVGKNGPQPIPVGTLPPAFRGLVQSVKAYESLTVEAAVTRSRRTALLALLNHPLVGDIDTAIPLLDEMAAAHGLELS